MRGVEGDGLCMCERLSGPRYFVIGVRMGSECVLAEAKFFPEALSLLQDYRATLEGYEQIRLDDVVEGRAVSV